MTICSSVNRVFFIGSLGGPKAPFSQASPGPKNADQISWTDVNVQPIDVECVFPATALDMYVTRLGPVGQALQQADDETRARVTDAVRSAFAPFVNGAEVRFTAACWMVGAG